MKKGSPVAALFLYNAGGRKFKKKAAYDIPFIVTVLASDGVTRFLRVM